MHRFFCPESNFNNPQVVITDPKELHHLRNVLRLKKGDTLTIFNDQGDEVTARILESRPARVRVAIGSLRKDAPTPPVITLACAIPKKSKFEWIVEKATELGVDEIIPLRTKRTQIELKGDRLERKIVRYRDVAINAAKQSQRPRVPIVHPIVDLASALVSFPEGTIPFIPSLSGERENILEAFKAVPAPARVVFLIGPEGDFTPEEYDLARARGCLGVSLGRTVLKVETAALVAVACAQLWFRR
ncbi:MAG: hypothetical protein A3C07_03355 [Candidatus Sungbacteria bacterium RIFCSPHIGHO2_02_FULL_47_11]|uniref:Ribosomal RNA small subunit methyltransferase E n=1 Tax=Candidatus Sungbacteria bacterium RIFCSPHIGHO2_02_FULL_47_11 TaxID=1802270 RepID=A0A1G2KNC9_9BACT|nr:MAG: hypothetical protein A3C07_03355 [Candidatus Sungbacteria bacterium RIFCSPHIGHO2_02_FULL_47_11]